MLDAFLELLKTDGPNAKSAIEGETLDKVFGPKKAVALTSFELSSQKDLTGGAGKKGKKGKRTKGRTDEGEAGAATDDSVFTFSVTKEIDNATPDIFMAFCQRWAEHKATFGMARVTIRKSSGGAQTEYLVYEFKNVWVKSWKLENSDGDDLPEEDVEFAFNTCKMKYWPQEKTGALNPVETAGWDFKEHAELQG